MVAANGSIVSDSLTFSFTVTTDPGNGVTISATGPDPSHSPQLINTSTNGNTVTYTYSTPIDGTYTFSAAQTNPTAGAGPAATVSVLVDTPSLHFNLVSQVASSNTVVTSNASSVGTFTVNDSIPGDTYTIDYGEGYTGDNIVNQPVVSGPITLTTPYTTLGVYDLTVSVSTASGVVVDTGAVSVDLQSANQTNDVAAASVVAVAPGQAASASVDGTQGTLAGTQLGLSFNSSATGGENSASLYLYNTPPPMASSISDNAAVSFDVRLGHSDISSAVTVLISSPLITSTDAVVSFYDQATGRVISLVNATNLKQAPSAPTNFYKISFPANTPGVGLATVTINDPSILIGTVFAITLPSTGTTTTSTISPAQAAAAPAASKTVSDTPLPIGTSVTFTSSGQLGGALTASGDSVSVSGAATGARTSTSTAAAANSGAGEAESDANTVAAFAPVLQMLQQDGGAFQLWLGGVGADRPGAERAAPNAAAQMNWVSDVLPSAPGATGPVSETIVFVHPAAPPSESPPATKDAEGLTVADESDATVAETVGLAGPTWLGAVLVARLPEDRLSRQWWRAARRPSPRAKTQQTGIMRYRPAPLFGRTASRPSKRRTAQPQRRPGPGPRMSPPGPPWPPSRRFRPGTAWLAGSRAGRQPGEPRRNHEARAAPGGPGRPTRGCS